MSHEDFLPDEWRYIRRHVRKKNWITAPEVLLAKYDSWSETLMQLSNKISADDLKVKQVKVRAFIFTSEFIVISLIVLKDS